MTGSAAGDGAGPGWSRVLATRVLACGLMTLAAVQGTVLTTGPALSADLPFAGWPDDRFHRVAALAILEQLRASLLSEPSATRTLSGWCVAHRLSGDGRVTAERLPGAAGSIDPAVRASLQAAQGERIGYRHVRLSCNGYRLSDAENWYVPSRLTAAMNHALDTTDTPFGTVVAPLGFSRRTLSSRLLWSPLPADWITDRQPARPGGVAIPDALIENRALLARADGMPFSLVVETYQRGLLDFRPPAP